MTTEELLKPRIIVENNYPRSPFKHHEIICEPSLEQIEWAKEFTINFRFLNWWEGRDVKDMPEYLLTNKDWSAKTCVKVEAFYGSDKEFVELVKRDSVEGTQYCTEWFEPATEQEYLTYISNQNT